MSTDLTQHLTEFQQQGLTCFPQQLDPTTVAQWQSVFQNQPADPPPNRNRRDTYQLIQKYPQLTLPFVANAQVLDFLEILMGPFVSLEALEPFLRTFLAYACTDIPALLAFAVNAPGRFTAP